MSTSPALQARTADTAFGRIDYLDQGQGAPVLVVHGSPGGHDQGALMTEFLVRGGLRAIIPSRPGYLGSELNESNGSIDGTADAHAALMAGLGIDRYAVLCWSGGGPSCFRLAVRHGDKLRALVALAAVSRRYEWHPGGDDRFMFGTALGNWILKIMGEHAQRALVSATLGSEGDLPKAELEALVAEVYADETKRRFVVDLAGTVSWRGARKAGLENDQARFAAITDLELARCTVPTLLVHGRVDTDVTPEHSEFAAAQIPGAQLEWVERGGHLAVFTDHDSDALQARILDFLARG
jgi:pimeloyl-ACP methyl ester carboxylesterase